MKKYVLLTIEGEGLVNFENLEIEGNYYVSKTFHWREFHEWIQHRIDRRRRLKNPDQPIDFKPKKTLTVSRDQQFKQQIMKVIEDNMANPNFGVELFAREVGTSVTQLYRRITFLTKHSPNNFIRQMRLQRAADLFILKAGNVSEVGYQVGFNNLSYFSKCFKEKFGVLPSEYNSSKINNC